VRLRIAGKMYRVVVVWFLTFCRKFPKYHMKILLGDLNAKVGRENFIGIGSLHEISIDNGVRLVNSIQFI
jgi:hypothetical protein